VIGHYDSRQPVLDGELGILSGQHSLDDYGACSLLSTVAASPTSGSEMAGASARRRRSTEHRLACKEARFFIPDNSFSLTPVAHQPVVDAALAMRYMIDIDGDRDRRAALILEFFSVVGHLALGAEFSGRRKLPPDLWPLAAERMLSMPPPVIIMELEVPAASAVSARHTG